MCSDHASDLDKSLGIFPRVIARGWGSNPVAWLTGLHRGMSEMSVYIV